MYFMIFYRSHPTLATKRVVPCCLVHILSIYTGQLRCCVGHFASFFQSLSSESARAAICLLSIFSVRGLANAFSRFFIDCSALSRNKRSFSSKSSPSESDSEFSSSDSLCFLAFFAFLLLFFFLSFLCLCFLLFFLAFFSLRLSSSGDSSDSDELLLATDCLLTTGDELTEPLSRTGPLTSLGIVGLGVRVGLTPGGARGLESLSRWSALRCLSSLWICSLLNSRRSLCTTGTLSYSSSSGVWEPFRLFGSGPPVP